MNKTIKIKGLDCAACAAELEQTLKKINGVLSVVVSFMGQKIKLDYESEETLERVLFTVNHFEEVKVVDETPRSKEAGRYALNEKSYKKEWLLIAFSVLGLVGGLLLECFYTVFPAQIAKHVLCAVSYILVGYPVLRATLKNLMKGKFFDENFLMTVASIGAVCIGEIFEGVTVMLLYQIGETLQSIAVNASRRSVVELMNLKSEHADVISGGQFKRVAPEEIEIGDLILIKAGEKIPVDGVLLSKTAQLDCKSLTGEAEYRTAKAGDELLSGCVNVGGVIEIRALRQYVDSAVHKILDLVENAASKKAAPEKFITKFSRIYTPIVCLCALAVAVFAPLLDGLLTENAFYFKEFERWFVSALTLLVISCPCALIISVPLTYFSGLGACAKRGVLVKGATHLDVLANTKIFAFDKTGTLTTGEFTIQKVTPAPSMQENELLALAAALERGSAHPIAKAFEKITTTYEATEITEKAGLGLLGVVNGETLLVGNREWLNMHGVACPQTESEYTLVYVAKLGVYQGVIEIGDSVRPQVKHAIAALKKQGVSQTLMLTGDKLSRAERVAKETGIDAIKAELLPQEKLEIAENMKKQGTLVYVGDGINDAPVMASADCAVSMGKLGSAAAVEASDIVLISDDLNGLVSGVRVARKTRKIVRENIVFSIAMKMLFMTLGAIGFLSLAWAVFADVGVMLVAVFNSFRVKR